MKESTCKKTRNLPHQRRTMCIRRNRSNRKILDAKYAPADPKKIPEDLPQLDQEQQNKLLKVLQNRNKLFNGTLGQCK